ncbi:hypothetical protein HanPSC8_Chr01g0023661 [Helianthus annuus]|nr:hypothetical protein HanPSC8_Chr01g0023661 [Helianthus annuus]
MAPKRKNSKEVVESNNKKPSWGSKKLSDIEKNWRPQLYREKLEDVKSEEILVPERKTELDDFRHFGLVEGFERLGWLAALTFNNKDNPEVYQEEIIEWMSTLRKVEGDNHPWDTKLIGTVNKTEVTMSMKSLLKIAPFDTLPQAQYETRPDNYICLDIKQAKGQNGLKCWKHCLKFHMSNFLNQCL